MGIADFQFRFCAHLVALDFSLGDRRRCWLFEREQEAPGREARGAARGDGGLGAKAQQLLPLGQREVRGVKDEVMLMHTPGGYACSEVQQGLAQRRHVLYSQLDFAFLGNSTSGSGRRLFAAANFRYYTLRKHFNFARLPDLAARTEQPNA